VEGEMNRTTFFMVLLLIAAVSFASGCDGDENGTYTDATEDAAPPDTVPDVPQDTPPPDVPVDGTPDSGEDTVPDTEGDLPAAGPPGSLCNCDSDCQTIDGQAGICVFGICMIRASGECSAAGSTAECPAHLRCWGLSGQEGYICWPDCDTFECAGACDSDGSCVMTEGTNCDPACGSYCSGGPAGDSPIGGPCTTSNDCADADATCYPEVYDGEPTGFVQGYCLIFGCPAPGAACGTGGICIEGLASDGGNICMGDCAGGCDRPGYVCTSSGYCGPGCGSITDCPDGYACDGGICVPEPCTPGSCPEGQICVDGVCILDIGEGPGPYTGISCDLPPLECTGGEAYCSVLTQFDPTEGIGYIDYPENGETWDNQYRSWLRRDAIMLIQYATAKVACMAEGWDSGNGAPLGLIDMSEEDGSIPGTSDGHPGHPPGTHTNGFDIDVAYYQSGVADNRARPICDHYESGSEAYHCTATPHLLDAWRTALFLGALFEHPELRVVGCDGRAGPILDSAITTLCSDGWLTSYACSNRALAYEEVDTGAGWFYFHHHHMHISFSDPYRASPADTSMECLVPGCNERLIYEFYKEFGIY